jgi:hypothetical protein
MWPDDGRLISHGFSAAEFILGCKRYAVTRAGTAS